LYTRFTDNSTTQKDRIFLRIPVNIQARIFIDDHPKDVYTNDLSTSGLSFDIDNADNLVDCFEMHLRLPRSFKVLKITLKAVKRIDLPGKVRIGCRFLDISREDKECIDRFVTGFVEFALQSRILNVAAFFLFIDAVIRIFLFILNIYYEGTPFGKTDPVGGKLYYYGVVLFLYAVICLAANIFSNDVRRKGFMLRVSCISAAFIFIAAKNISYLGAGLWHSGYPFITAFLAAELAIVIYTGFAVWVCVNSIKKVIDISKSLYMHSQGINRRI
jgi:hypothetical protein